jgi:DNA-binding NarL/FixJ family response regulator
LGASGTEQSTVLFVVFARSNARLITANAAQLAAMKERCEACGQLLQARWTRADHGLTFRQWEYVRGFAEGLSNKALADRLFVDVKTVKHFVTKVGKIWGLRGKIEIALRANEILSIKDA